MSSLQIVVKLDGLAPMLRRVHRLEQTLADKVMRRAFGKVGGEVVNFAKPNIRKRSGALRRRQGYKVRVYRDMHTVVVIVGTRKGGMQFYKGKRIKPEKYDHFVELGHDPNTPAYPYLRPAVEGHKEQIVATMGSQIGAGIEEVCR